MMVLHRCTETDCPHFGQRTNGGCRCHQTDEQMLRASNAELLEALRETVGRVEDAANRFHNAQQWHAEAAPDDSGETLWEWVFARADAAIAKATPQTPGPDHG